MIKAIVYTSNTGFTKKYAEMLSNMLSVPAYEFKESKGKLNKKDEICYMGWLMAGGIKNYEKARKIYNIKATCAVGMTPASGKQEREIKERHHIKENLYYMQGGYDKTKLKGINKFLMNMMEKKIASSISATEKKTEEDKIMLDMIYNGKDCVKEENLKQVEEYLKS